MVQFDKPSGRGNSGVHRDLKEGITNENMSFNSVNNNNNINNGKNGSVKGSVKGSVNGDNKSMTSRQSNYKNVPTDQMRSMSSMMMMGKNTITSTIPIEEWNNLQYSKNSHSFFTSNGQKVEQNDLKSKDNNNSTIDEVEKEINATQHLTISNNNKKANSNSNTNKNESYSMKSACVTTDFSMQNVLMQMGLNVISVDGMLIR